MADNYAVKDGTGSALTKASKDLGAGVQADKQVAVDSAGAEILGVTTGTKVVTDANGTLQQYLRGLVTLFTSLTFKAASTAPLATDPALVVAISPNSVNANGSAAAANSAPVTASTEDVARVGIITETAPATDIASSGLNGRLQRVAQRLTSMIALLPTALGAAASSASLAVTLPSDQAASVTATFTPAASGHTAPACNGAAQQFSSIGLSGRSIMITGASLEIDGASAEASAWRLYLYNVTPPSATADASGWDLVSGDRASFLGYVDLGTAVDLGSTQWVETQNINKQIKLSGTGVFAYLINLTTVTPAAVAHIVTLNVVQL